MQEDEYRGDGLNLYAYCKNNPVVYYDPSGYGEEKCDKVGGNDSKSGRDTWNGDKQIYSVAYEVELPSDMYPGVSDARHFQEANRQLHEAFERNPQFAQAMETLYPGIIEGVKLVD